MTKSKKTRSRVPKRPVASATSRVAKVIRKLLPKKKVQKNRTGGGQRRGVGLTGPNGIVAAVSTRHLMKGVRFSAAPFFDGREGLRLSFSLPYFLVQAAASSSSGGGTIYFSGASSPSSAASWSPTSVGGFQDWLSVALSLMSTAFSRYLLRSLTWHYRQKGGVTSERAPMIFAWADDPEHPLFSSPTIAKLENIQHNIEFNAWEDWDMDVRVPSNLLFTAYRGTDYSDVRQAFAGDFALLQQFAATNLTAYGTMYCSGVIDLYDFSPVSNSGIASSVPRGLISTSQAADDVRSADEKEFELVPPRDVKPGPLIRTVSARPLKG